MPSNTGMSDPFFTGTDLVPPVKATSKLMVVVVIVDASKSMEDGGKIAAVNVAMKELVDDLKDFASDNDVNLKMAVISFASDIQWELKLTDIGQCDCLQQIQTRVGQTRYGIVFHTLNKVISRDAFLSGTGKNAAPLIVFLTDGEPTDRYHQLELEQLEKNKMFHESNRHVILMGDAVADPVANEKAEQALRSFVSPGNSILHAGDNTAIISTLNLQTFLGNEGGTETTSVTVFPFGDDPSIFTDDPNPTPGPIYDGDGIGGASGGTGGVGGDDVNIIDDDDDDYSFVFGVNT